jgi:uncharacterized membrane protein
MSKLAKILFVSLTVLYPFLVLAGLLYFKTSPRLLSLCLVVVLVVNFLAYGGAGEKVGFNRVRLWATAGILTALIVVIVVTNSARAMKLYPVLMNLFLLGSFGFTLLRPPSMIFRFALLAKKSLRDDPQRRSVESYCRTVTIVWCGFFFCNACASLVTALWASDFVWTLYNGLISYILIGLLFFGEMGVRALKART